MPHWVLATADQGLAEQARTSFRWGAVLVGVGVLVVGLGIFLSGLFGKNVTPTESRVRQVLGVLVMVGAFALAAYIWTLARP